MFKKSNKKSPRLIFSIPKSASTNFARIVSMVGHELEGAKRGRPRYMVGGDGKMVSHELRDKLFSEMDSGQVVNMHTFARSTSLWMLGYHDDVKYIVYTRDPRDQIVASYCDFLKEKNNLTRTYNHFGPVPDHRGLPVHDGIDSIIKSGYMVETIIWLDGWLRQRHPSRSIVIKYEDYVTDVLASIEKASEHFFGHQVPEGIKDKVLNESMKIGHGHEADRNIDKSIYAHGYTGKIGVWKDYFNDANLRTFKEAMVHAAFYVGQDSPVFELYGELC